MPKKLLALLISTAPVQASLAAEQLGTIEVKDLRQKLEQAGLLKDEIQQTEVISAKDIERKQAANVTEAIQNEPGVNVSTECSMCGVKRVMINGLKGEHTTVLVDGVPTHSMISGFYGLDGVASAGVERVEIARGAGASLLAPEAVGGSINIVTQRATKNAAQIDLSTGNHGYRKYALTATGVTPDGKTRATLAAQYDDRDQADADSNGVSESPFQENQSVNLKLSHAPSASDTVELRVFNGRSEVFGGPVIGDLVGSIDEALRHFGGEPRFLDNDVRKRYTGLPGDTAEWVLTHRLETVGKWLHEFSPRTGMSITLSNAKTKQDSFYEGLDYRADDDNRYGDVRLNHFLGTAHLLTVGLDHRHEKMRSRSAALEALNSDPHPDTAYVSDSFDYRLTGLYLQDTWTPAPDLELAAAVRLDKVSADYLDPHAGKGIDETLIAPRLHLRYDHSQQWTSRVQLGRGYRAPLSFFESDHGILDNDKGFRIEVDTLEKSTSASYALSYNDQRLTGTASLAWNRVDNLAYLHEDASGVKVLGQLDEPGHVVTADLVLGYQIDSHWLAGIALERFQYDDVFKSSYTIAPVEERVRLTADYEGQGWSGNLSLTWIGSRDLAEYGYAGYNTADDNPASRKSTHAPAFYTVDMKLGKALNKTFTAYVGVNNLFNYTQVGKDESPLFFHDYTAPSSYDVVYIYGPLRGRTFYAGVKAQF